jgi:tetratricopeptide (TPR) repeat protein
LSAQNLEIPLGADLKVLYQIWAPPVNPRKYAGKKLVVEYVWGRVAIAGQVKSVRDDVAREQFDPHGSMLNGKVISLSDAPAGNYRMVVTIVDPETQHKTYGTLNFAVVPRLSDSTATWYVYDEKSTDTAKLAEDDYDRALCYLATGNQENALYWLAVAIERDPQDQLALSKLVSLYSEKKDFTRIAALYPRFVVNKDTNEETVIQVADALQRTGRLPQAVVLLETTSSSREPSGALLLALSGYYRQMGQVEKANAVEQRGKSLLNNAISSQ